MRHSSLSLESRKEEQDQRYDSRRPLDIYMNKLVGDYPFMVRTTNISTTGIYLNTLIEPDLKEGSQVSLEFQLPGSEEVIWVRGAVMREAKRWGTKGLGVWFTIVPKRYQRLIEQFVFTGTAAMAQEAAA